MPQRYDRAAGSNVSLQKAQEVADTETGNEWKRMYLAQIRQNRGKRGLFYFSENEAQNAIVRQAVSNWYNPTSHDRNRRWVASNKARG